VGLLLFLVPDVADDDVVAGLEIDGETPALADRDVLGLADELEPLSGLVHCIVLVGRQLGEPEVGPEQDELVDVAGTVVRDVEVTSPASIEAGSRAIANS
jgi:hypothetical protein